MGRLACQIDEIKPDGPLLQLTVRTAATLDWPKLDLVLGGGRAISRDSF